MTSPASRIRRGRPAVATVAPLAVAIALSIGSSHAQAEAAASSSADTVAPPPVTGLSRSTNPFGDHFPNVVLKAHIGRNVRFYEDLLKDKIVLINFMYATCTER